MGIASVVNACSHLQNASRARLGLTSLPNTKYNLLFALALHRQGLISSLTRAGRKPPPPDQLLTFEIEPVTSANVATRRLWVGLKYVQDRPVLKSLKAISMPKRAVTMKLNKLERLANGFWAGPVKGLALGDCLFLATDVGVLEIREAIARKRGGLLLAMTTS